jgi:GNAT superfamily N-acetyltransferase
MAVMTEASSFVTRLASATDAEALADLAARAFRDTFAADNRPEDIALHVARSFGPDQQRAEIVDSAVRTVLVEQDARLVAYAQVRNSSAPPCVHGSRPVELWRFYIDRPWIGRGVAQGLMETVCSEARGLGGETVWLGVWERNPRALAFYGKCGFVDVGAHVFAVGEDEQTDRIMVRGLG